MNRNAVLLACLSWRWPPRGSFSWPRTSPKPQTPAKEAPELIRRLSDESYEVRDSAVRRLVELGKAAEAALRKGLNDEDPEVRRQCQVLLERSDPLRIDDRPGRLP